MSLLLLLPRIVSHYFSSFWGFSYFSSFRGNSNFHVSSIPRKIFPLFRGYSLYLLLLRILIIYSPSKNMFIMSPPLEETHCILLWENIYYAYSFQRYIFLLSSFWGYSHFSSFWGYSNFNSFPFEDSLISPPSEYTLILIFFFLRIL